MESFMELDLDLDNYELNDIYHLFHIHEITEDSLREAKKIVLKTHPDKSKLDSKFFLFYSAAYKRLFEIYEFQNKRKSNIAIRNDYIDTHNQTILQQTFQGDKQKFNSWFNDQFVKFNANSDVGHGDWLKSDDDLYTNNSITKNELNSEMIKQKKRIQQLTVYRGVEDAISKTNGTLLSQSSDNFTTDTYTDLKQAYIESVIPVTDDDYQIKYNNLEELKRSRITEQPLDKTSAQSILNKADKRRDEESAAQAFKYAKQLEESQEKNKQLWSNLYRINS
jgi:hypothetical protein